MPAEIVSEKDVDEDLTYLITSAEALGEATREARFAEHMLKHTLALEMKKHGGSAAAQEREARASEAYLVGSHADAMAAGNLAVIKAKREACVMRIEVWRTQGANTRVKL